MKRNNDLLPLTGSDHVPTMDELTGWALGERPADFTLTGAMKALDRMVAALPKVRPLARHDIVAWNDEAVEVELVAASGNVTVRLPDGGLKTVRKHEISRI
jgi:hypothetical protein